MSTQAIGARRAPRLGALVLALALTFAVITVAIEASSIWSGRSRVAAPARVVPAGALTVPEFIHPGKHRGQVRFGALEPRRTQIEHPHRPQQMPKRAS